MRTPRRKPAKKTLDLQTLKRTPGFVLRLLQLSIFEAFYRHFAELGLTPATYAILVMLRDNPGVGASDIASVLRLQLPNLIKLLNELEAAGLVKRTRSPNDGRAIELGLMSKGEKLIDQALKMTNAFNELTLAKLDATERRRFLDALNKLVPL